MDRSIMEEQVCLHFSREGSTSGSTGVQYHGDGNGGSGNENEHRCSINCLNGLLHSSKTSSSFSSTIFQHGQYDLILDRPSMQKWWDDCYTHLNSGSHHHHHHRCRRDGDGVKWDSMIVMELMRVLQTLHSNNITIGMDTNTKKRKVRIVSVFISMDIFQDIKTTMLSPQEWSEHQQHQSNMIRTVLSILKESLPQLQSVHLYNGHISSKVFAHSVSRNLLATNAPNLHHGDIHVDDADVDRNAMMAHDDDNDDDDDDRTMLPSRHDHRLYHRWNRFHIINNNNNNNNNDDDDERDDRENDLNAEIQMFDQENDEDDSDNEDTEFPVMISGAILASIIESSTLESIIVTRCLCFDNSNDVSILAKSIQNHPRLSSMHLASMYVHPLFFMNGSGTSLQPFMDPLIMALSSLPQLESLNITLAKESRLFVSNASLQHPTKATSNTIISPERLQQLIAGTSIKDLTLWECLLNGAHLSAISNALLYGSCHCQDDIPFTRTEPKQTSLQFLSLRCNPNITCDDWCTFYTKTLPNCFSIQSIYNDHVCGLADCDPNAPQHGKACSGSTREGLRFWDFDTTTSDESTSSELSSSTAEAAANAELFLGLNSLGRGSIIQGSYANCKDDSSSMELKTACASENEENLLDLLSDVTDTPSALYALIRSHPIMILSFIRHHP